MPLNTNPVEPYSRLDRFLLGAIRKMAEPVAIRVEIGHGSSETEPSPGALPAIRLQNRSALIALVRNPGINFGELYSRGQLEVEGDLVQLIEGLYHVPQGLIARIASRCSG